MSPWKTWKTVPVLWKDPVKTFFTSQFHLIFDREGNDHYDHHGEREIVINTANSPLTGHWSVVWSPQTRSQVHAHLIKVDFRFRKTGAVPLLEVEDQALGRSNPLIAPCSMLFIWLDSLNLRNWEWECKYWKLDLKQPLGIQTSPLYALHLVWKWDICSKGTRVFR